MSVLKEAIRLNKNGFNVVFADKNKAPIGLWTKWQTETQSKRDVQKMYDYAKTKESELRIGVICKDGLEVIDIDVKYFLEHHKVQDIADAIIEQIGFEAFKKLVWSKTVSGGYHLIYKAKNAGRNEELASRYTLDKEKVNEHDKTRTIIETRANGGYIMVPPSNGYAYDNPSITITDAVEIEDYERNGIIAACKTFDETEEFYTKKKAVTPQKVIQSGKSTIEDFNEKASIEDLIIDAGWQYKYTRGKNKHYVRPGKTLRQGIGGSIHTELNLFYVFSPNTSFDASRAYNAFQVYARLNTNGDFKKAWKELYQQGYGDRLATKNYKDEKDVILTGNIDDRETLTEKDVVSEMLSTKFDINNVPPNEQHLLYWIDDFGEQTGIAGRGDMVLFTGAKKTGKSSIASCAASCFLQDSRNANQSMCFKADFKGGKLIHLDTEQSEYERYNTCAEMMYQQQILSGYTPPNFLSYRLTDYDIFAKLRFFDYIVRNEKNIDCVFLDGLVDLCSNYNDLEESQKLVNYIRRMASKYNFLLLALLHNARSTGLARGHLGGEAENRCKAILNTTRDKDSKTSTVEVTDLRGNLPPMPFEFGHCEDGHIIQV